MSTTSHRRGPFEPLLSTARRAEVEHRVLEIAGALRLPHESWALSRRPDQSGLRSISLALGRSGTAVFEAWLSRSGLDPDAADHALARLGEVVELLPSQTMDASLLCGFTGVAWTVEHLVRVLDLELGHDVNASVDATLMEVLRSPELSTAYDLIDGLAGQAVYALQRRERSTGLPMLTAILDGLEQRARPVTNGVAWPSGQLTKAAHHRAVTADQGYFNLGLSHGVPGAVGALARMHAVPALRERVRPLLEASSRWLMAQRLPGEPGRRGMYPDFVSAGVASPPARLAWCYGDPGVAASLAAAGLALDRPELVDFAVEVAHAAARRDPEDSSVVDDGLCHGTAGLVHIFHRLYRATGDRLCREAARYWLDRLLERKEDRPHIAGFTTFCFERTTAGETIEDPAWLTGAAGVGLVLLSALTDPDETLPDWDQPLLIDLDA